MTSLINKFNKRFLIALFIGVALLSISTPGFVSAQSFDEYVQQMTKIYEFNAKRAPTQTQIDAWQRDWNSFSPAQKIEQLNITKQLAADPGKAANDPKTDKCTNWLTDFTFDSCIGKPILSWLASLFLMFGALVLRLAGMLFEALIQAVVVDFGGTLNSMGLAEAIAIGWTIIRDLANILIIGMFAFIAISIILGIKEYGQKKLIANVLIVAMLLNFSFLFTRLVIDVSNYTAFQVYSAMAGPSGSGTVNIAEGFLTSMRITSIWEDSGAVIAKMADDNNGGGTFTAFGFGLLGGIMLLTVALVLLYGCIIIAARGMLFVFLMVTAAGAFATYLIPGMAQGEYGFSKWWKTLLNAAIFAPLLMIFLAISLVIVRKAASAPALVGGTGPTPLGTIVADPTTLTSSGGWMTILLFALATGLLFLSIRLSSKFASSVSGMGYVPGLFRNLAAAPFALTAGRIVAPLMQRTIGARAFGRAGSLIGAARTANLDAGLAARSASQLGGLADRASASGNMARAAEYGLKAGAARELALQKQAEAKSLLEKAAKAKITADKTFNAMDSGMAKAINKAVGNAMTGESEKGAKGYASQVEDKAKKAAALAESARPGEEANERARRDAEQMHADQALTRQQAHQDAIARQRDAEQAAAGQREAIGRLTEAIRAEQDRAKQDIVTSEAQQTALTQSHEAAERALIQRISAAATEGERAQLRGELQDLQRLNALDQKKQNDEIATKEAALARLQKRENDESTAPLAALEKNLKNLADEVDRADRSLKALPSEINESAKTLAKQYREAAGEAVIDLAGNIGQQEGGRHVADAARSNYKKRQGNAQRLKELFKDENINAGTDRDASTGTAGGTTST